MTSSAGLRSKLLAARDRRHALLMQALPECAAALLFFSLNLPGAAKLRPGALALFHWGYEQVRQELPEVRQLAVGIDLLGPYTLLTTELPPAAAKAWGVRLEERAAFARLLDLDVYDRRGTPLDRAVLVLPQRACLLCPAPARECIRQARHPIEAVLERVDELLAPFRD